MSTYRSRSSFSDRFGRQHQGDLTQKQFAIANYLQYQGKKLVKRFDANTYITLSQAMDSHDVTRPDRNYESVLKSIQQPTSIVGITSDILYPPVEQEELASLIPNSRLMWLNSSHGHDGFLIDLDELNALLISYPTLV